MDKSFEKSIIEHGAATLAGIKTANLFNYCFASEWACKRTLQEANSVLNGKGVYLELLSHNGNFYLLLIYRRNMLHRVLCDPNVAEFLEKCGYRDSKDTDRILGQLKRRLIISGRFPHEIGVFLGYPIEDIKGFIRNEGKNCLICGLWKVYSDPLKAEEYFRKIDRCNRAYMNTYRKGVGLADMTVAA